MNNTPNNETIAAMQKKHTEEVLSIHAAYFDLIKVLYGKMLLLAETVDKIRAQMQPAQKNPQAAANEAAKDAELQILQTEAKLLQAQKHLTKGFIAQRLTRDGDIADPNKQN